MNAFANLTEQNYLLYAIKEYDAPECIQSEFESDFKRIKYLKRLFRKYRLAKDLKERLILNHIICLGNVFGVEATTRLLFFQIDKRDWIILKTFLLYLNYMPNIVMGINNNNILSTDIPVDLKVAATLREL